MNLLKSLNKTLMESELNDRIYHSISSKRKKDYHSYVVNKKYSHKILCHEIGFKDSNPA